MGLKRFIVRRVAYSLIILFCVMTVQFSIFNLMPGDPMDKFVSNVESKLTREDILQLRQVYGLDQPMYERYVNYLRNMLTFNFGRTTDSRIPVVDEISKRLGNTLILMGIAVTVSIGSGTLLGTLAAYKRGKKTDTGLVTSSLLIGSLPVFWIGILMLWAFAVNLRWFPIGGTVPMSWAGGNMPTNPLEIIYGRLLCLALPVLTLVLFTVDNWTLLTRACVLQTITEDYAMTARAKGLRERSVLLKHVLKPASLPLITAAAMTFAGIFGGAIITETVFSYEGMGRWLYLSIMTKDLPIMYTVFFISAILTITANALVDLLYGLVDPRIKAG